MPSMRDWLPPRSRHPSRGSDSKLNRRPLSQLERLEDRTAPAIINLLPHPSSGEVNGAIFTHLHGLPGTGGSSFLAIREQPLVTGIEQGYNTDGALEFDTKEPTRAILLSEVPLVNVGGISYREFILERCKRSLCPPPSARW